MYVCVRDFWNGSIFYFKLCEQISANFVFYKNAYDGMLIILSRDSISNHLWLSFRK